MIDPATPRQRARLRNLGSPLADREELTQSMARDAISEAESLLPPTKAMLERAAGAGLEVRPQMTRGELNAALAALAQDDDRRRHASKLSAAVERLERNGATVPPEWRTLLDEAHAPSALDADDDALDATDEAFDRLEEEIEEWEMAWQDAASFAERVEWEGGTVTFSRPKPWTPSSLLAWQGQCDAVSMSLQQFDVEWHWRQHRDQERRATKAQLKRAATELVRYLEQGDLDGDLQSTMGILDALVHREAMRDALARIERTLEAQRESAAAREAAEAAREAERQERRRTSWWARWFG